VASGGPWESIYAYSRAVRAGDYVFVSGTTAATSDGSVDADGDAAAQARRCFAIIERALMDAGASLAEVVRTRMFIVNPADSDAVGRVHGEVFGEVRPAATMVVVAALIDPRLLVEIEVDAVVGSGQ
jgi:enamine deaminase RidA (YjgF/YER057c/UK114 family)